MCLLFRYYLIQLAQFRNFFSALCDIQFNLLTFGFGKKRCFDEFFFKSRCCCCVQEVLPHNHHSPAITPSTTTTWEGLQSSSLLRPTITSNPFSISWAFKLAHEMPCVVAGPLFYSTPSCRKIEMQIQ